MTRLNKPEERLMDENARYSEMFTILGMIFVAALIVSNLIAGKMWSVFADITVPASVILFPVTYMLADVFTEIYGFRRTRIIIWTGFACNFIAVFAYVVTVILPYPSFWLDQDAFGVVFGMTPRVLAASFAAYLIGEFSNSIIMSRMKVRSNGKRLWERIITSTLVGEAFDTIIFVMISFVGIIPSSHLFSMIFFQYMFKVCFEIVLIPLTYWVIGTLKTKEGIDVYDNNIKYNVFR